MSGEEPQKIKDLIAEVCHGLKFEDHFWIKNDGVVYDLGHDSKILSKIYEIIVVEALKKRLTSLYNVIENPIQNKYPDVLVESCTDSGRYYAVDVKSTYLKNDTQINGFTLGTYKGYFRDRSSMKNIVKPYDQFIKHYCICVVYQRQGEKNPVQSIFVREKWKLACCTAGSGNTCHIGSMKNMKHILEGKTYFESEGAFDAYWLNKP